MKESATTAGGEGAAAGPGIAVAPISWGVCPLPDWGRQLPAERVLDDMRTLGVSATETGPEGFLGADAEAVRAAVDSRGISLIGRYLDLPFHGAQELWRPALEAQIPEFRILGVEWMILAVVDARNPYEERVELGADDWERLLTALSTVEELARDAGLRVALHPHVSTAVEGREDVERVLEGSSVPLCLDTGHLLLAGADPAEITRLAPERIGYVHLKDVDLEIADAVERDGLDLLTAIREGVFCRLGSGVVDLGSIVDSLRGAGYEGWYVYEQDVMLPFADLDDGEPLRTIESSLSYLRELTGSENERNMR